MMTENQAVSSTPLTVETPPQGLPAKADLLRENIMKAIEKTEYSRTQNRNKAAWIKIFTLFFSTVVTVLLGIQVSGVELFGWHLSNTFTNLAFVFGAVVTLLNALEPFFNFRAFWVDQEKAVGDFWILVEKLDYYRAGLTPNELDETQLGQFQEEYQRVWSVLSEAKLRHRQKS